MYRADLPRTLAVVVALFLAVIATRAFAREFRAADTRSKDYPTVQALYDMGHLIEERTDDPIGNEILDGFEPYGFVGLAFYDSGTRSIYNNVRQRDPAAARLIERIRQVE